MTRAGRILGGTTVVACGLFMLHYGARAYVQQNDEFPGIIGLALLAWGWSILRSRERTA